MEMDAHALGRADLASAIDAGPAGVFLIRVQARRARAAADVLNVLRHLGFLVTTPSAVTPALRRRHLALVVDSRADRRCAVACLRRLAATSPRRHAVVLVGARGGTRVPRGRALPDPRGTVCPEATQLVRASSSGGHADRDVMRLAGLLARGHIERADAWLSCLDVVAELLDDRVSDELLRVATWLRLWQCRYEEAQASCGGIRNVASRRLLGEVVSSATQKRILPERPRIATASPAMPIWIHGACTMFLLSAIPGLLRRLADADDELCALRSAGNWAVDHAGSRGVAFLNGGDGRVAAMVGWGGHGPAEADRLFASRAETAERRDDGVTTLAVAPVREAGVRIGSVLVIGPSARAGTLAEAANTLALLCASPLRLRIDQVRTQRRGRELLPELIGDSPAAVAVREAVARAASTPFPVLVEGESGTGKELVARALHRLSARRERRFVAVNCAAISDELVESELFGHSRGAFTGAVGPRVGLFEDANGGTLFLDEVAELSARAQAKLLRALQEREVRRVGENLARPIDVRVVAATNRALADACEHGEFRDDLRFRLAVVRIRLAPLRERAEDVAPMARAFWSRTMREVDKQAVLGADALSRLAAHGWSGNVRELQNVMAGLALVAPVRGRVRARHVDLVLATSGASRHAPPMSLERARRACEQQTVAAALARHAGRRSAAARELGITRQGLAKIMRRLHLAATAAEGAA